MFIIFACGTFDLTYRHDIKIEQYCFLNMKDEVLYFDIIFVLFLPSRLEINFSNLICS